MTSWKTDLVVHLTFAFDKVGRNMRQALQNDPNFAAENNTQST